jgi:hypothetical protein
MNQQLARLCVAIRGSEMQSGISVTRTQNQKQTSKTQKYKKNNQKQISYIKEHLLLAFKSTFP